MARRLRPIFANVFAMVQNARDELALYPNLNPHVREAARWMLMNDDASEAEEKRQITNAFRVFEDIMRNEFQYRPNTPNKQLGRMDFVVYCDFQRFKWDTKKLAVVDTENKEAIRKAYDLVDDCRVGSSTLAFVADPDPTDFTFPSQIQLCNFFMDYIKNTDQYPGKGFNLKTWFLAKKYVPKLQGRGELAPIDVISPLERTLLHEITHTTGAGGSKDFDLEGGIKGSCYGWPACRDLARKSVPGRMGSVNADSLTLLATAIHLTRSQPPQRVTEAGDVVPLT